MWVHFAFWSAWYASGRGGLVKPPYKELNELSVYALQSGWAGWKVVQVIKSKITLARH